MLLMISRRAFVKMIARAPLTRMNCFVRRRSPWSVCDSLRCTVRSIVIHWPSYCLLRGRWPAAEAWWRHDVTAPPAPLPSGSRLRRRECNADEMQQQQVRTLGAIQPGAEGTRTWSLVIQTAVGAVGASLRQQQASQSVGRC